MRVSKLWSTPPLGGVIGSGGGRRVYNLFFAYRGFSWFLSFFWWDYELIMRHSRSFHVFHWGTLFWKGSLILDQVYFGLCPSLLLSLSLFKMFFYTKKFHWPVIREPDSLLNFFFGCFHTIHTCSILLPLSGFFGQVLLSSNSELFLLSFNIWYGYDAPLFKKMRLLYLKIIVFCFNFHLTSCPNFFRIGVVLQKSKSNKISDEESQRVLVLTLGLMVLSG